MNRQINIKVFSYIIALVFLVLSILLSTPTFATDSSNVVETTFFGNINDEGDGCGVFTILNLVVDILSIGVGVLGVIGISVAGIQYLSSAGKEEQARKSRTRIFQIIIGLALYALMYTGINWLTPGGKLNTGSSCSTIDDKQLAKMRAAENKAKQAQQKSSSSKATNKSSSNKSSSSNSADLSKWYDTIDWTANYMKNTIYGGKGGKCGNNYSSNFNCSKTAGTCVTYSSTALQKLGVIKKNTYLWIRADRSGNKINLSGSASGWVKSHTNTFKIINYGKSGKSINELRKKGELQKGDVIFNYSGFDGAGATTGHTMIFKKFNSNGDGLFNSCGPPVGSKCMKVNKKYSKNYKISIIVRLKKTSL